MTWSGSQFRAPLPQRAEVVQYPDTSPVGACDKVALAGVDEQVVHRYGRQVVHQRQPGAAPIQEK